MQLVLVSLWSMSKAVMLLLKKCKLILLLSKNDLYSRYLDSVLGVFWAFIQPIATLCVLWFVFQVGFKSQPIENVPFIVWLASGMVPWFIFSDIISNGTSSVIQNSYLVKKVVFPVGYLPLVSWLSSLTIGIVFNFFLFFLLIIYKVHPSIYWIQIPYLFVCISIISLSIVYFTSAIVVFFKDMGHLVNIFLQFGFWLTPVFWSKDIIPTQYYWLVEYNPIAYVVEGYRMAILSVDFVFYNTSETIYFWCVSLTLLLLGKVFFHNMKEHFADIL